MERVSINEGRDNKWIWHIFFAKMKIFVFTNSFLTTCV